MKHLGIFSDGEYKLLDGETPEDFIIEIEGKKYNLQEFSGQGGKSGKSDPPPRETFADKADKSEELNNTAQTIDQFEDATSLPPEIPPTPRPATGPVGKARPSGKVKKISSDSVSIPFEFSPKSTEGMGFKPEEANILKNVVLNYSEYDEEDIESPEIKHFIQNPTYQNKVDITFSRQVRNLLEDIYRRHYKLSSRGKLNTKRLAQYKTSQAIFKRREHDEVGYRVTILIDSSGSMNSMDKNIIAGMCTLQLAKACEYSGIETSILNFYDDVLQISKFFTEKLKDTIESPDSVGEIFKADGDNPDFSAMYYTQRFLDKNPSHNKKDIVIMLSDGEPFAPFNTSGLEDFDRKPEIVAPEITIGYMKKIVEDVRTKHGVNLNALYNDFKTAHGVAIFHDQARKYIFNKNTAWLGLGMLEGGWQVPKHKVIKDLSHFKVELIKLLRSEIKKGVIS